MKPEDRRLGSSEVQKAGRSDVRNDGGSELWRDLVRMRLSEIAGEAPDADVVEELAAHLAQVYDSARARGASDASARQDLARILEASEPFRQALDAHRPRDHRRGLALTYQPQVLPERSHWMSYLDVRRDARFALRMLARSPLFSLVAVLTFAVGIGINTAVFSVVDGVLLRALPYPNSEQITMVWLDNEREGIKEDITSYPNYLDWRDQNTSYAHLAAFTTPSFSLSGAGEAERVRGASVTANFFDVMGVRPAIGQAFGSDREIEGRGSVVVLSHGLWQRQFGGAPDAIGRSMQLNGRPYEIVGVMPAEFRWPDRAELWTPLAPGANARTSRFSFWLPVIGRLKPGVTVEQAQAEMSGISSRIVAAAPQMRGYGANVVSLRDQVVGNIERPLLILMVAVGFVLLIACANLANLTLGRTAARKKELAIRTALGAGRATIIRQIITESLVLSLIGAVCGIVLAHWTIQFFVALGGDSLPRRDEISLHARAWLFAFGLATVSALISGLIPALQASRQAAADHLKEGGRQGSGSASRRTRQVLVAAEVALALVLLTGAGLLARTLWHMQAVDRGFTTARILTARVSIPPMSYPETPDVRGFQVRALERVRALPGVESAALTTGILQPLLTMSAVFSIEGQPLPPPEKRAEYPFEMVSPGFFETLGYRVIRGRTFTDHDGPDATPVVVINETLARQGWPGQDPLGRRMRGGDEQSTAPWLTVVGVVRDVRRNDVTRTVRPELYMSALQSTPRTSTLVIRTSGEPTALISAVRGQMSALDPQVPLYDVGTLESAITTTLSRPTFQATLLAGFATLALLLAAIGIYGVTAHAVSQRTQEVGIRMALGASRGSVLLMMLGQHLRPAIAGVVIGLASAFVLSRFLRTLLFGVGATDPLTFALMAASLLLVAVAACLIPSMRAMRVDPLVALRDT